MRGFASLVVVLLLAAAGLSIAGYGPIVWNREGEQHIASFFGDPVGVFTEPGLGITWPFVTLQKFDGRWRHLSSKPENIPTADQEVIVIDHYAVWRIADPLQFRRSFPGDDAVKRAEQQIGRVVLEHLRQVVGRRRLVAVLRDERAAIVEAIAERSRESVARFGVDVRDVRINRTELPQGIEGKVYARMAAERDRLARKYRAEGEEEARRIRAEADRDARVIVAKARGEAEAKRGGADAAAAEIYASAYSLDPEFYDFVRTLEAYRKTIGKGTTLVLPPDHAFFRMLEEGAKAPPPPAVSAPPPRPAVSAAPAPAGPPPAP
jgi:membrane protease subunit HflC